MQSRASPSLVNLHVHSDHSLLRSNATARRLIGRAAEFDQPALALTDHDTVSGLPEFEIEARARDVKPILGVELSIAAEGGATGTVVLLAESNEGLRTLERLSLGPHPGGSFPTTRHRLPLRALVGTAAGLIALTGSSETVLARLLRDGQVERARGHLAELGELLGEESLFVQAEPSASQSVVREVACALARQLAIEIVCTAPVYTLDAENTDALSTLRLDAQSHGGFDGDANRGFETHLRSGAEMAEVEEIYPGSLAVATDIAERCDASLDLASRRAAAFPRSVETPIATLRRASREGLLGRYGEGYGEAATRLEHELTAIERLGFADRFLLVRDIVELARGVGAVVGPGRGPMAGSIVNYCLGITDVDPVEHGLLFERFTSSRPVIHPYLSLDIDPDGRERLLDAIRAAYGERHAGILTVGRRSPRSALRLAARALDRDPAWSEEFAQLVPASDHHVSWDDLRSYLEREPRLSRRYERDPEARSVVDLAMRLEGLITDAMPHACAQVFADCPLGDLVPLASVPDPFSEKAVTVTQLTVAGLDRTSIPCVELFGLNDLGLLCDVHARTREHGAEIPAISNSPLNDETALNLLARGDVRVSVLDHATELLRLTSPRTVAELAAIYSLARPGTSRALASWEQGRGSPDRIKHPDPRLEPILADTYGALVYQEQLMLIAQEIAGLSPDESNDLRRAVGKKHRGWMRSYRERFVSGALERGTTTQVAELIWRRYILEGSDWAFCKAHAVSYALIAYRAAWFCSRSPSAYWSAVHEWTYRDTT